MASQAAAARMADGGAILNVASMYGLVSPQPDAYRAHPAFHNPPAYGAAKAGVIAFTRYAAVHLASRGIRVNAIAPGPFPSGAAADDATFVAELARRVPLGRIGTPDELGAAAVLLLSPGASYITGQTVAIDGGWTAW
jgi:gluconate 5-dehydrogenase